MELARLREALLKHCREVGLRLVRVVVQHVLALLQIGCRNRFVALKRCAGNHISTLDRLRCWRVDGVGLRDGWTLSSIGRRSDGSWLAVEHARCRHRRKIVDGAKAGRKVLD